MAEHVHSLNQNAKFREQTTQKSLSTCMHGIYHDQPRLIPYAFDDRVSSYSMPTSLPLESDFSKAVGESVKVTEYVLNDATRSATKLTLGD